MMLTYLALLSISQTNEVLQRFENYMKEAKTLSVSLKLHVAGQKPDGAGAYVFERPLRQSFRMRMSGSDYVWNQTERGILEIEHSRHMYHDYPALNGFSLPNSSMSTLPQYGFPIAFPAGTLRSLIPGGAEYGVATPKPDVEEGASAISSTFFNGQTTIEVFVQVAKDGRLLSVTTGPKGYIEQMGITLSADNYVRNAPPPAGVFSLELPIGYVPEVLPVPADPVNVGMSAPLKGLKSLPGGSADLAAATKGKSALIVVAGNDCEPSVALLKTLSGWKARLKAKGAEVAVVWTGKTRAPSSPTGFREFVGPKGGVMASFGVPATPFWLAVDKNAKITQVWVGFDPTLTKKYEAEALAAVSRTAVQPQR